MCDLVCAEEPNDVQRYSMRRAAKSHVCDGCGETIAKGSQYFNSAALYDGHWSCWKHCPRCDAMFHAIANVADDYEAIDPSLDCGDTWESALRGPLPDHVAALAFWLPGEPIPTEHESA